jgi:hypothetical protein
MKKDHMQVWFEQMTGELKAIHELVAEVPRMARKLDSVAEDVIGLKRDMQVVKAAVTATNHDVDALDRRVTRLEAA